MIPVVAISAGCTQTEDVENMETTKNFKKYLRDVQGRWAGNISNFKNVKEDNTGLKDITGDSFEQSQLQPLHPLSEKINPDVPNYGSYHAYLWLKNEVTSMGYANKDTKIMYPGQAEVTKKTEKDKEGNDITFYKTTPKTGTTYAKTKGDKATERGVYYLDSVKGTLTPLLKTQGVVTQGFLWRGPDRANGVYALNNVGSNLIVTIEPGVEGMKPEDVKDFWIVSHYDSTVMLGEGYKKTSWGATDNGTGAATSLSLLQHYSKAENKKKLGVRLHIIFADAEEVGVLGTNAFVRQFLTPAPDASGKETNELLANSVGMINLDTVAGGDKLYVHSPNTPADGNTSTHIRDQLNALSTTIAKTEKNYDGILEIHPQFYKDDFKAGETGDWSDHAPFYLIAKLPIAYIESTNFNVYSKEAAYDGYAQTKDPKAWVTKKGDNVDLVPVHKNGSELTLYDLPEGMKLDDILIAGDIWHSHFDRLDWVDKNRYPLIYKQLNAVFKNLVFYFDTIWEKTTNDKGEQVFVLDL